MAKYIDRRPYLSVLTMQQQLQRRHAAEVRREELGRMALWVVVSALTVAAAWLLAVGW